MVFFFCRMLWSFLFKDFWGSEEHLNRLLQLATLHFNCLPYFSCAKLLKVYLHLKVLWIPLNFGVANRTTVKLGDNLHGFHTSLFLGEGRAWVALCLCLSYPSFWTVKSSSEGNVCSLPQSCLWFISPVWGRILPPSVCYLLLLLLLTSSNKIPCLYLVLVVPQLWTFECYELAVEQSQECVSLYALPLQHAFWLVNSQCSCNLGSAVTLGQAAL